MEGLRGSLTSTSRTIPPAFPDWIDAFVESTEHVNSPTIFRRWSAIFTIATCLERRVWLRVNGTDLFPNLYIFLIGGPGVGKGQALSRVRDMLDPIEDIFLGASSLTHASLIDALANATRKIVLPVEGQVLTSNPLSLIIDELGVMLPAYSPDMMNRLQHLYDGAPYSEERRTSKLEIHIPAPILSMIAGTTPNYMSSTFPEGAWEQGFTSRTLLVYCGAQEFNADTMFDEPPAMEQIRTKLRRDLSRVLGLSGAMQITAEAQNAIKNWVRGGMEPRPDHPRLTHYLTRRHIHLIKLAMIASVATSSDLIIKLNNVQHALDWLVEIEFFVPDIFKSMASGGDGRVIEETYHFIFTLYAKKKEPVVEARIFHFLAERTPAHNVERLISIMTRAGMLKRNGAGFIPQPRMGS